ncbi:helix-turn-helix domain-containing protein [Nostocoides sp. F2B08]|uniref:helix-turn-helix domain-containing protein n=1 Tax=Nostocoides sp. F2B08 TaxID=2653936 RepID=UPI001262B483|nr:helix-turn-helix transcriptional regulator [Tetrasphaera sp. F2B08]KAB7740336.1 helix-turn-helix domain-containing protein [Tetrasphaera sp. F2B08]
MDRAPAINPDALRRARQRAGLTQLQLALRIGVVGGERISSWERGLSRPRTPAMLHALARALDVPATSLLAVTDEGPDLRWLRFAAGLSAAELAHAAGVSVTTIHRWENGQLERPLPSDVLADLATALKTSTAQVDAAVNQR